MAIDRRGALKSLAGGLITLLPAPARAAAAAPRFLSTARQPDGDFALAGFDAAGMTWLERALPGRGHGIAVAPDRRRAVVIARRPGRFAVALDLRDGSVDAAFDSGPARHFYGHGIFSPDGRLLYTTENDFEAGIGVVGLRDAEAGYRKVGEFPAHGVGPHDIKLLPDGETLVLAIGGIRTHPASGRRKLNLATMEPAVVFLERRTGRLSARLTLPAEWHRLSLRHLALAPDGRRLAVAAQYQGPREDRVPLVALSESGGPLRLLRAPAAVERESRNYCGDICFDDRGSSLVVSHPKGGLATFWSAEGCYLDSLMLADGCGLAPAGGAGRFLLTGGTGVRLVTEANGGPSALPQAQAAWDNHVAALD